MGIFMYLNFQCYTFTLLKIIKFQHLLYTCVFQLRGKKKEARVAEIHLTRVSYKKAGITNGQFFLFNTHPHGRRYQRGWRVMLWKSQALLKYYTECNPEAHIFIEMQT